MRSAIFVGLAAIAAPASAAALHYAADLALQDMSLRMTYPRHYLVDGKPALARKALVPLAYNLHGGKLSDDARRMIALIDSSQAKAAAIPATTP